ncbi:MAG: NAD(P)/FAD-dependent oxidoreductase [Oligoflexus sp.]|nr:NAD(P)/FAD-dependent oxidoreductase [Pseudopedobacter sp.]
MTIPSSSEILIHGINISALAFAVTLSANGAKVLIIDERTDLGFETADFVLDDNSLSFLKDFGFKFSEKESTSKIIDVKSFVNQSLKLLAENLCSVIWEAQITKQPENNYLINQNEKESIHQTNYFFESLHSEGKSSIESFHNTLILAWRLIGVFANQTLNIDILNSYTQESELLNAQHLSINSKKKRNSIQKWLDKLTSQSTIFNLIDSKVSLHLSQYRNLQAGELLPNLNFYDEKKKEQSNLYAWCNYKYFSVIIFGSLIPTNLFTIAKWVKLHYPVQLFYLPFSENNEAVFDTLQIRKGEKKTFIVRPDKFIGLLHDGIEIDIIDNYLKNFIFMKEKDEKSLV